MQPHRTRLPRSPQVCGDSAWHHSPSQSLHSPAEVRSPEQRNTRHGAKASSIVATEPRAPPCPSTAGGHAARPSTDTRATDDHQPDAASQALPLAPPQDLPVDGPPKPAATECADEPTPTSSTSERLWNTAYDRLETSDAELVGSYLEILEKFLGREAGELSAADLSAKMKDPTTRQVHMRELVQRGQEKISKASRITTGVGNVAGFILSAKDMVNLVLQSVPQAAPAALPWAGVCLGLQVSNCFRGHLPSSANRRIDAPESGTSDNIQP